MAFLEDVIFPLHISRGSTGGPEWLVDIVELSSGREERNTPWSAPRRSYDAKYAVRTQAELYEILSLYHVASGALNGFRLLDWTDYLSCAPDGVVTAIDQVLGTGDGVTTQFELWKVYTVGTHGFSRRINKPFGGVKVAIDGAAQSSGYSADLTTGVVSFDVAPAPAATLTWGGQFHVPVRFDGKLDETTLRGEYGDIPSIRLKELKL